MPESRVCIIIAGPTAVGKTALSVQLATHLQTSIISADSRQCYTELNIAVAKPSDAELAQVRHYFINSHHITDDVNAAAFESYALKAADEIFSANRLALMVGGTGLYIKAFTDGIDEIPPVPAEIRSNIREQFSKLGMEWLREELNSKDRYYASHGEMQNPQRMMRALEVMMSTGRSIKTFHERKEQQRPFSILKIGLELPKPVLNERIDLRVDQMIGAGLVEEVRSLLPFQQLNALQTVGYREIFEYLNGRLTLTEAISKIKINTRQYAKRQMTWFKKDKEIKWFAPHDYDRILAFIQSATSAEAEHRRIITG